MAGKVDFRCTASQAEQPSTREEFFKFLSNAGIVPGNPTLQLSGIQIKADEASDVHPLEPKEYKALLAAVPKSGLQEKNTKRVKACMQLQRWSGLSLVDAVCLSKDELLKDGMNFRVKTERSKTGAHVNNVMPAWLGKELLAAKNGNPEYFFISGEATPKGAVSVFDKMYRTVFEKAGIKRPRQLSHTLRHTFAVELLKAGVDIRKVNKALGHSSVTITERYYAKWNKAQQDILDGDLARAWKKQWNLLTLFWRDRFSRPRRHPCRSMGPRLAHRGFLEQVDPHRAYRSSKIAHDITDRKQAEEAVKESESRFRLVADTAPVLIWM
jgi:site-specific recombinase XerD